MRYLVKSNIKGPLGPAMIGEIVELDEKLGAAMVASGLVESLGDSQSVPSMDAPEVAQPEKLFSKKKKGK